MPVDINKLIREGISEREITVKQLAEFIGKSYSNLNKTLNKKAGMNLDTFLLIADELGIEITRKAKEEVPVEYWSTQVSIMKRVDFALEKKNMKRKELSERLGISVNLLHSYFGKEQTLSLYDLFNISKELDVSLFYLLTGNNESDTEKDFDKDQLIKELAEVKRDNKNLKDLADFLREPRDKMLEAEQFENNKLRQEMKMLQKRNERLEYEISELKQKGE